MKVLWFSLSPCGSMKRSNSTKFTQTWMVTLEERIKNQNDLELSVAFYCNASSYEPPFDYEGVHYYPIINRGCGLINKIKERFVSTDRRDIVLIKRSLEIIRKVKPDIIHVHGTESNFGLLVEYVKDIPIIISLQGVISPIVERYYAGIPMKAAKQCDSIKDYIHQLNEAKVFTNYKHAALREQRILRNARYIVGRTEWDRQLVSMMAPQANYFVVNEIIREEFRKNQWNKTKPGIKFCIISILSNGIYKGYELVLKAAALLKQYTTFDYEWKVIGCDENYKYVKAAKLFTNITPSEVNVHFIGRKLPDEMISLMLNADLYVQTSHIENSSNALCEALVLGMPCLATNVGGTTTILRNGGFGELYPAGDPYVLSSRIIAIQKDYLKVIKIANNARVYSLERNSDENVASELNQAYNEILKKNEK